MDILVAIGFEYKITYKRYYSMSSRISLDYF